MASIERGGTLFTCSGALRSAAVFGSLALFDRLTTLCRPRAGSVKYSGPAR